MSDQEKEKLQDEIEYLRRELRTEKQERIKLAEALNDKFQHCSRLMKERDDLAYRLRKIQAAFDKETVSHNLEQD